MKNITTIIPIHKFNDEIEKLLTSACDSIADQKNVGEERSVTLLVFAASIEKEINEFTNNYKSEINLVLLKNEGNTDFQSQINFAAENISTNWFVILEFDDELSTTFYKNTLHHIEKMKDVDLFLPIIVEVNDDQEALKITNETVWSKQFVGENGEMGFLNVNALNQYTDFKFSGGVFNTEEFKAVGGLKTNIKLTFTYEFLLRLLNNGSNIYSIPKIGVKHLATREGSLFDEYSNTLTIEERKFWFETAKKESNFFNDRVIDMSLLKTAE